MIDAGVASRAQGSNSNFLPFNVKKTLLLPNLMTCTVSKTARNARCFLSKVTSRLLLRLNILTTTEAFR